MMLMEEFSDNIKVNTIDWNAGIYFVLIGNKAQKIVIF